MENNSVSNIHEDVIPTIFKDKDAVRYHVDNCKHLYKLMVQFELAFTTNDEPGELFVPAVFPINKLTGIPRPKPDDEPLARKYSFEIALSESIFPRYIQRNHQHIRRNESGERFMCRDEMFLVKNATYAIVTKESRKIEITVWGKDKSAFLQELHEGLSVLLEENWSQWERDEVKLSNKYYETDFIRELHHAGVEEIGGQKIEKTVKVYNISLINIKTKIEKAQASLAGLDITGVEIK